MTEPGKDVSGRRRFDWEKYLEEKSKRRRWNGVLLFAAMIILLFVSAVLLEGRHYLLIGFGGVALVLVLFFGQYERRKPRAREVVLLSTLTALCVVMNEICAHTIPLHAGTTMVVICGIGLGPETGFLIGAMSRLVCNFFDGQGPWTPWQMAAWGMVGYLSGLAFNKVERRRTGETLARRLPWRRAERSGCLWDRFLAFYLHGCLLILSFCSGMIPVNRASLDGGFTSMVLRDWRPDVCCKGKSSRWMISRQRCLRFLWCFCYMEV